MTTDNVYLGTHVRYGGMAQAIPPSAVAGKKVQSFYLTCQAQTANVWAQSHTAANALSAANGQLESGHFYALAWINSYGANSVAIRCEHASWGGIRPGGMSGRTISHRKCFLDFAKRGALPVFAASNPLNVYNYNESTDTMVIVVGLIDLGTSAEGGIGLDDHNLAMKAVTDGGGLELLAAVTGDSMTVKDGFGTPGLVACSLTGTAPLRGQIAGSDPNLKPAQIEIPPHCTLAGDYINEIGLTGVALLANSAILPYGSS